MLTLYYLMKKNNSKQKLIPTQYYNNIKANDGCLKNIEDLNNKCRVCLKKGSVEIFGNNNSSRIIEALQKLGNIYVNENDEHPKCLCYICYEFIECALLFKQVANRSEEILKKPLKEENIFDQSPERDFSDDSTCYDIKDSIKLADEDRPEIKKEKIKNIKCAQKVTCNICSKVINRSYYKEHMTMHDPDHKKYVCDVCGKSFRLRCAYHNHSLRHRNDFPYKCQFCPYRGRYSELLKTHMRTHTGDYRYMCTECPARFLFKSNLNSHMLKHKEPQFKCEGCKRAFHTKLMLQRHYEADHLGIKNHVCNICGKAFGYRNAMMKHQRHVHKREKLLFGRVPAYLVAEHRNDDG